MGAEHLAPQACARCNPLSCFCDCHSSVSATDPGRDAQRAQPPEQTCAKAACAPCVPTCLDWLRERADRMTP